MLDGFLGGLISINSKSPASLQIGKYCGAICCLMSNFQNLAYPKASESQFISRAATAGKTPKAWALPRFWISIRSYKKQLVKKMG